MDSRECAKCKKVLTQRVMPKHSFCGSDGLDRVNCWLKCYECKVDPVCPQCMSHCKKCHNPYCKDSCISNHRYVENFIEARCNSCERMMTLETSPNVCGFKFKEKKNYWINFTQERYQCLECYDKKEKSDLIMR